jgi:DNA repair protein RadC
LEASDADIRITIRVKEALELVDIKLLDHLILNMDEKYATINV